MSKSKTRRNQGGLEGLRRILAQEEQARADAAAAARGGVAAGGKPIEGKLAGQKPAGGKPATSSSPKGHAAAGRKSSGGASSGRSTSSRRPAPGTVSGEADDARPTASNAGSAPASMPEMPEIFPLDADDHALFQRAVKGVTRIDDPRRALLPPVPSASARELRLRREAAAGQPAPTPAAVSDHYVPAAAASDASSFLRAGCGPDLLKGLRRGKWLVGATLDLHGSTLEEARQRLDQFLQSCLTHQVRCVCVIHGKGHGSRRGEPVLKTTVRRWLGQLECVQAYVECREEEGGSGAVQVLLRVSEGA